jgi:predicted O-methyltransferase YrrM
MNDTANLSEPEVISAIWADTKACGFEMASDSLSCSLLRTLSASKPGGRFLELGSGSGLSTAWILDGMDANSRLTTVDNDAALLAILKKYLGDDQRLEVVCTEGEVWIGTQKHQPVYDFIFADTWPGKYRLLEEVLEMIKPGGFYVIDDMDYRPDWPDGHAEKATNLISKLEQRNDFHLTKMSWASGLIIAVKKQID